MLLEVSDTHLGGQGMEGICDLRHCLVPLVMQCGPSCVLFIVVSKRVTLFLDDIHKRVPSGLNPKYFRLLCGVLLTLILPPMFDMGAALRSTKVIFSLLEKIWTEK
jgi:hypothetical protein